MLVRELKDNFKNEIIELFYNKTKELNISVSIDDEIRVISSSDNTIDLFIPVKLDDVTSNAEYRSKDFDKFDGGGIKTIDDDEIVIYDGEFLALNDLEQLFLDIDKIQGVKVNIRIDIRKSSETIYAKNSVELKDFLYDLYDNRLSETKHKLQESSSPNVFNSEEAREMFSTNARNQHFGESEQYMVSLQGKIGGGEVNYLIEHMGDLIHRMSQGVYVNNHSIESSIHDLYPKIKQALPIANSTRDSLGQAFDNNLKSNYYFNNKIDEDFEKEVVFETFQEWKDNERKTSMNNSEKILSEIDELNSFIEDPTSINKILDHRFNQKKKAVDAIKSDISMAEFELQMFSYERQKIELEKLSASLFLATKEMNSFDKESEKVEIINGLKKEINEKNTQLESIKSRINNPEIMQASYLEYKSHVDDTRNKIKGLPQFKSDMINGLLKYASLHSELKCYNHAQYYARKASISVGLRDQDGLRDSLVKLKEMIDNESFVEIASSYDPDYDKKNLKLSNKADKLVIETQAKLKKTSSQKNKP